MEKWEAVYNFKQAYQQMFDELVFNKKCNEKENQLICEIGKLIDKLERGDGVSEHQ